MKRSAFDALSQSRIVRDYEAAFRGATGMSIKLVPADAGRKRRPLAQPENPFCALITKSAGGCAACHRIQAAAQLRAGQHLQPQTMRCFAGLTDVAVPVVIGDKHIATLLGGQVLQHPPLQREFSRLAKTLTEWGLEADLHRIEEAYFHTRVVDAQAFNAMVQLLTVFARHLADFANQCLLTQPESGPASIRSAREYVRKHAAGPVGMRETARHVHLSAFYFCKLFKKQTGMTFTEFVARVRVEKACNLLLNPATRITEIAHAAGFQSIPHFNRTFKRVVGQTPTAYRAARRRAMPDKERPIHA